MAITVRSDLIIPESELQISASRSGGPGGQHVNKTSTRITVRWDIRQSACLTPEQKTLLLTKLASKLTQEGELIVHHGTARSQQQNKLAAITNLAKIVRQALYIPKKRLKTAIPKSAQIKRLDRKSEHGLIKKLRNKAFIKD
jgi:ribosome-associated protein